MLTLQVATELLKKDNPPVYFTLILSNPLSQHDINAYHSARLRNTSVTRICIYAEQPDTILSKPFLDAMLDVVQRNIHITDLHSIRIIVGQKTA